MTRQQVDARVLHREGLLQPFGDGPFAIDRLRGPAADTAAVHVTPVPLAHDRSGVFAFEISAAVGRGGNQAYGTAGGWALRLGFATDLGRLPEHLTAAFRDVDLLAIESNYDPPMQHASARPASLKRRIMGGRGHLSNAQALAAIRAIVDRSTHAPAHSVLLHLSRQCNCPNLLRRLYREHPDRLDRLHLTHHQRRTP